MSLLKYLACCFLLLASVGAASAQISPVKITVSKRQETKNVPTGQMTIHPQTYRTLIFDIEVVNLSAKPVEDLVIHWSILVQPSHTPAGDMKLAKLADGNKKATLKVAERMKLTSDAIELSKCTGCGSESQLIAYIVEAQVNGKTVASDTGSTTAKEKIDAYKSAQEQKAKPPRRVF